MTNGEDAQAPGVGNYAEVNGLSMYYEIHGTGEPLVLLQGACMKIGAMGEVVRKLAKTWQVIAVELQGHGRPGRPAELPAHDVARHHPRRGHGTRRVAPLDDDSVSRLAGARGRVSREG